MLAGSTCWWECFLPTAALKRFLCIHTLNSSIYHQVCVYHRVCMRYHVFPSSPSRLPAAVPDLYESEDVFCALDLLLLQPHHLHLLLTVLQHPQLGLPVQQVKHLQHTNTHTHTHTHIYIALTVRTIIITLQLKPSFRTFISLH